jgi:hypothetical protein
MTDVFISYQRQSSTILAHMIKGALEARKISVYLDVAEPNTVGRLLDHIRAGIDNSSVFMCLLGASTLDSKYVLEELDYALNLGKPLIPIIQEEFTEQNTYHKNVQELLDWRQIHLHDTSGQFVDKSIEQIVEMTDSYLDSRSFSPGLRDQLVLLGKAIERLTD